VRKLLGALLMLLTIGSNAATIEGRIALTAEGKPLRA